MSIWVEDMQADLRHATTRDVFIAACAHYFEASHHVKIDRKAVETYARSLRAPSFIPGWDEYVSKRNQSLWARTDDFIELAVSTSINAGYLYADANGNTAKWEVDGSGAKALLGKMNEVRNMQALPALHLKKPDAVRTRLSDVFNGIPHGAKRLEIWAELARPGMRENLRDILYSTRSNSRSKQHHFTFDHIRALTELCPLGFGDDPFLKKAMLLPILFAGLAHNRIAAGAVTMDALVASDYRLPQTQHNIGLLRFSDDLVDRLDRDELMAEDDEMVMDIRAGTVLAQTMILTHPDVVAKGIQAYHLDADQWFAGRLFDKAPDKLDAKYQSIRASLQAIGDQSGWSTPGFTRRTPRPMAVATMWF